MTTKVTVACLQTNSAPDIEVNLERINPMIRAARERGAELIALPENANLMIRDRATLFSRALGRKPTIRLLPFSRRMRAKPARGFWQAALPSRTATTGWPIVAICSTRRVKSSRGTIKFICSMPISAATKCYRESNSYRGGKTAVVAPLPWGKLGLTICYDLRFPHLFRTLAKAGASIIAVPAAFTATTGKLHWHVLLRARAIETGCFIIAPAQCGTHDGGPADLRSFADHRTIRGNSRRGRRAPRYHSGATAIRN